MSVDYNYPETMQLPLFEVESTPYQMVREYHREAGLNLDEDFGGLELDAISEIGTAYNSLIKMRYDLIREEYKEVDSALGEGEILKELCDLMYVILGYGATFGWDMDEAFKRVHENNMERMTQDDGTIKRREDGKIIKNPNTYKVYLDDLV